MYKKHNLLFNITIFLILIIYLKVFVSQILTNLGFVILVNELLVSNQTLVLGAPTETSKEIFLRTIKYDSKNTSVYRALGLYYVYNDDYINAFHEFQNTDLGFDDFIIYAEQSSNKFHKLNWYKITEKYNSQSLVLWRQVGTMCQQKLIVDDICNRFMIFNQYNLLVDPLFSSSSYDPWMFNPYDKVTYFIAQPCSEWLEKNCATVIIDNLVPQNGASWWQKVVLEPGQKYYFSAWIKVDLINGFWRPIYYVGAIDGKPQGSWPGDQTHSSDWTYWEREFVAKEFDDNVAYFSPVLLSGNGKASFFDARLQKIR